MIKLSRIRTPSKITKALKGQNLKKKLHVLLIRRIHFEQGIIAKFKVPAKWKPAKKQLIEEAHGKCAFCECEIPSHQHGDVEHYRPKSIYWWMAYTIDNYLLSCEICNQRKSNTFDTRKQRANAGVLPSETDQAQIEVFLATYTLNPNNIQFGKTVLGLKFLKTHEQPKLLSPYLDDPELFFDWKYDDILKEVEIIPKQTLSSRKKTDAKYTIDLLDLNRVPLMRRRYIEFTKFKFTKELGADEQSLRRLYLDNVCEFAAMNKFFDKHGF